MIITTQSYRTIIEEPPFRRPSCRAPYTGPNFSTAHVSVFQYAGTAQIFSTQVNRRRGSALRSPARSEKILVFGGGRHYAARRRTMGMEESGALRRRPVILFAWRRGMARPVARAVDPDEERAALEYETLRSGPDSYLSVAGVCGIWRRILRTERSTCAPGG